MKLYVMLLIVAMLVPCLGMNGMERKKNKKKAQTEQVATTVKKTTSKNDKHKIILFFIIKLNKFANFCNIFSKNT